MRYGRLSAPLGYERVYLPLNNVADTPIHIQGEYLLRPKAGFQYSSQKGWVYHFTNSPRIILMYDLETCVVFHSTVSVRCPGWRVTSAGLTTGQVCLTGHLSGQSGPPCKNLTRGHTAES